MHSSLANNYLSLAFNQSINRNPNRKEFKKQNEVARLLNIRQLSRLLIKSRRRRIYPIISNLRKVLTPSMNPSQLFSERGREFFTAYHVHDWIVDQVVQKKFKAVW